MMRIETAIAVLLLTCLLSSGVLPAVSYAQDVGNGQSVSKQDDSKREKKAKSKKKVAKKRSADGKNSLVKYTPGAVEIPSGSALYLKMYDSANVEYKGAVNYDNVDIGGTNQMYPGGHAGVFLVSIFTHAAIAESAKNSKKDALQKEADKVLLPYQDIISGFTGDELAGVGLSRLDKEKQYITKIYNNDDNENPEWILETKPVFEMTGDQRVLLLKNIALVRSNEKSPKIAYQNLLEIHSAACESENPETCWRDREGQALKDESIELFAKSIELVLSELSNGMLDDTVKEKTFSYLQGGEKKYQRGKLALEECGRITIRTLRGWLLSVPVESDDIGLADISCDSQLEIQVVGNEARIAQEDVIAQ